MTNENRAADATHLEIKQLKQQNQRLRDTVGLLKEQLRQERSSRQNQHHQLEKAEIEIQMLRKVLEEMGAYRKEPVSTPRQPHKPPLPSKNTIDDKVSEKASTAEGSTAIRSILKKRSSNLSGLQQFQGHLQDSRNQSTSSATRLKTLKEARLSTQESTLQRNDKGSQKDLRLPSAQKSIGNVSNRSLEKRKSYFDKVVTKD